MKLTEEMQAAWDSIIMEEEPLYITGRAGTGKTTFLQYIKKTLKKNVVVAASTGIAALNAGGMTLHSLFGLPITLIDPKAPVKLAMSSGKISLVRNLEVLVIDEISMVRPDMLDRVNKIMQIVKKSKKPFGGAKVVMFGDLFQLPPVVKKAEEEVLKQFYSGTNFFNALVFGECKMKVVELTHIFRQTDDEFISILNNIRTYECTDEDFDTLSQTRNKRKSEDFSGHAIHICSFKRDVDKINRDMLGEATHQFTAVAEGDFNTGNAPCDEVLELRVGARVMMLTNDTDKNYYNGSLGDVAEIGEESVKVKLDSGHTVSVDKFKWTNVEYAVENGKIVTKEKGTFTQFPLALAWAITIHKSQGLTFDEVAIHAKHTFCPGQMYVALSRCRTLEGIYTDVFVSPKHIIPNKELVMFEKVRKENGNYFELDKLTEYEDKVDNKA